MEEEPPAGYAFSQSVDFIVPEEPEPITIIMKDRKTEVLVKKFAKDIRRGTPSEASPSEADRPLAGSVLQILNEDKTPTRALREGNGLKAGDSIIFTTQDQFKYLSGQLEAGKVTGSMKSVRQMDTPMQMIYRLQSVCMVMRIR